MAFGRAVILSRRSAISGGYSAVWLSMWVVGESDCRGLKADGRDAPGPLSGRTLRCSDRVSDFFLRLDLHRPEE